MRNKTSLKRQLKEDIQTFLNLNKDPNEPDFMYRDIGKILGCSIGTISYYNNPVTYEKAKTQKLRKGWRKVWRYCYSKREPYKNYTNSFSQTLRKKATKFLSGKKKDKGKMKHKPPKLWQVLDKIWPGIKTKHDVLPAVCQWTGKPVFDDHGNKLYTPWARDRMTGLIINTLRRHVEACHNDGDRLNNSVDNFSFCMRWANQMQADATLAQLRGRIKIVDKHLERMGVPIEEYEDEYNKKNS